MSSHYLFIFESNFWALPVIITLRTYLSDGGQNKCTTSSYEYYSDGRTDYTRWTVPTYEKYIHADDDNVHHNSYRDEKQHDYYCGTHVYIRTYILYTWNILYASLPCGHKLKDRGRDGSPTNHQACV